MGNPINLPTITPEAVNNLKIGQGKSNKESAFSTKNYLNTRLDEGEKVKEIRFRLLPMDLETGAPFVSAHFHTIRVPKDVFGTEWKSYLCLKKTKGIDHSKYGYNCPFCEINKKAYDLAQEETDNVKKRELVKISTSNKSVEAAIGRGIERGHEEDGVKFWKINTRDDEADAYNQIMREWHRMNTERGENIFDIFNGRDLIITITSGKNNAPHVSLDFDITPLSDSEEKMKEWVYDNKKWQDVFTPKDYDYLTLVSQQKYPWWDKDNGKWVDKAEFDKKKENVTKEGDEKVKDAENKLKGETPTFDSAGITTNLGTDDGTVKVSETVVNVNKLKAVENSVVLEDMDSQDGDDLPF